jgi:hypothetical protein
VARVVAFVPDLLFGSNVVGTLAAAGHEPALVGKLDALPDDVELLVVDLTADVNERIAAVHSAVGDRAVRVLAFYSHVEADVRTTALQAGFDLVVPRSRMAREGGELVTRLLAADE